MSIRLEEAKLRRPGVTINSVPYIGRGSLQGIGIIFVSTNNVVGRLIGSIIKQDYTSMGFYVLTTIRGTPSVQVIMTDHWSGLKPLKMYSLDDLISVAGVEKIGVKRIHEKYENKARVILSSHLMSSGDLSLRDDIKYIFGVGLPNLVDIIMSKLGSVKTSDSVSVKVIERTNVVRPNASSVIENIGSCMNQQISTTPNVRQIQSYLDNTNLLGQLHQLKITRTISATEGLDLSLGISTFIELLQGDDDFLQAVVDGIREGKDRIKVPMNVIEQALEISSTSRIEDLKDIIDSISRGRIAVEDINEIIHRANSDHEEACKFVNTIEPLQAAPIKMIGNISLTSNDGTSRSHRDLHDNIERLTEIMKESIETSSIVFDDVFKSLNSIRSTLGMTSTKYPSHPKFNLIKSHRDINVEMSSGDEIVIPISSTTDLSMLERNDLLEILQTIDTLLEAGSHPEYEMIRRKIAHELNSR